MSQIENKGGQAVSGTFGSILWDLPYLRPSVATASDVVLTLERQTLLPTDATALEAALAASLDKLALSADPATRAIIAELAYTASPAELRARLAQISGVADAGDATQSALGAVAQIGDLVSDVLINPAGATWGGTDPAYAQANAYLPLMADLPSSKAIRTAVAAPVIAPTWGVWSKAIGAYTRAGAGPGGVGSTSRLGGVVFGLDAQASPWLRVGVAGGWRGERTSARSGAETTQSGGFGAVYAQAEFGRSYLNGALAVGRPDVKNTRRIAFGAITTSPTGKYDARDIRARIEAGHSFALGGAVSAQPYVGLRYISLRQGAYQETGSPLALSVDARRTQAWDALAGLARFVASRPRRGPGRHAAACRRRAGARLDPRQGGHGAGRRLAVSGDVASARPDRCDRRRRSRLQLHTRHSGLRRLRLADLASHRFASGTGRPARQVLSGALRRAVGRIVEALRISGANDDPGVRRRRLVGFDRGESGTPAQGDLKRLAARHWQGGCRGTTTAGRPFTISKESVETPARLRYDAALAWDRAILPPTTTVRGGPTRARRRETPEARDAPLSTRRDDRSRGLCGGKLPRSPWFGPPPFTILTREPQRWGNSAHAEPRRRRQAGDE